MNKIKKKKQLLLYTVGKKTGTLFNSSVTGKNTYYDIQRKHLLSSILELKGNLILLKYSIYLQNSDITQLNMYLWAHTHSHETLQTKLKPVAGLLDEACAQWFQLVLTNPEFVSGDRRGQAWRSQFKHTRRRWRTAAKSQGRTAGPSVGNRLDLSPSPASASFKHIIIRWATISNAISCWISISSL